MKNKTLTPLEYHYEGMLYGLIPLVICSYFIYGSRVLLLAVISFLTARLIDVLIPVLSNKQPDSRDKSSIVAALTFCMMMPVNTPIYILVTVVIITTLIGKHAFGGGGAYPFSLSALAMCFAATNWPEITFSTVKPFAAVDLITGHTQTSSSASTIIKQGGLPHVDLFDILIGNYASAMGTSFILVIVAIGLYLMVGKRISWQIPFAYLMTVSIFALAVPRIYGIGLMDSFKLEMLTGGSLFYAFFVINEPNTVPETSKGKLLFGVLVGLFGMIFRYYGAFEIGTCFAVLLLNSFAGYMDFVFTQEFIDILLYYKSKIFKPKAVATTTQTKTELNSQEALNLISLVEDDIDGVEFSTRTIDMKEALKELEKKNRGAK